MLNVPRVEFMYRAYTWTPGESYRRRLRSLLLCMCGVFRALINSLECWFKAEVAEYFSLSCLEETTVCKNGRAFCISGHTLWVNPFTAPACKISGLSSARIHACKQYIWWPCNTSAFHPVYFDTIPFTRSCKGVEKPDRFQTWHFYWSFSDWESGKNGSERVNKASSHCISSSDLCVSHNTQHWATV